MTDQMSQTLRLPVASNPVPALECVCGNAARVAIKRRVQAALWLAMVVVVALLQSGCTSMALPSPAKAAASPNGALLSIRLNTRFEPPQSLALQLAPANAAADPRPIFITGRLQRAVPGQADYLMALALPAGHYKALFIRDGTALPNDPAAQLAALRGAIDVPNTGVIYLGRLVLRFNGATRSTQDVSIEDAYDDDTVFFKTTLSELRDVNIQRAVLSEHTIGSATNVGKGGGMQVTTLDRNTARQLPDNARAGFMRFLNLNMPRAFATDWNGNFGYATGPHAVRDALRYCVKQSRGASCRLFAVDQTLITSLSCQATLESDQPQAAIQAGCAALPIQRP